MLRPVAIFLDLDGVLADFDAALVSAGLPEKTDDSFHHLPPSEWTDAQRNRDAMVRQVMERPDFWPSIPRMHGALGIVMASALTVGEENVFVLTATPRVTEWRARIAEQKTKWAMENLGFASRQVITCLRSEKAKWAGPHRILVDDLSANCDEWEAAGGVAIYHTDARSSVAKLLELYRAPVH